MSIIFYQEDIQLICELILRHLAKLNDTIAIKIAGLIALTSKIIMKNFMNCEFCHVTIDVNYENYSEKNIISLDHWSKTNKVCKFYDKNNVNYYMNEHILRDTRFAPMVNPIFKNCNKIQLSYKKSYHNNFEKLIDNIDFIKSIDVGVWDLIPCNLLPKKCEKLIITLFISGEINISSNDEYEYKNLVIIQNMYNSIIQSVDFSGFSQLEILDINCNTILISNIPITLTKLKITTGYYLRSINLTHLVNLTHLTIRIIIDILLPVIPENVTHLKMIFKSRGSLSFDTLHSKIKNLTILNQRGEIFPFTIDGSKFDNVMNIKTHNVNIINLRNSYNIEFKKNIMCYERII